MISYTNLGGKWGQVTTDYKHALTLAEPEHGEIGNPIAVKICDPDRGGTDRVCKCGLVS